MSNRILVDSTDYKEAHGKAPRGRGSWAFCTRNPRTCTNYLDHTRFFPGGLTFQESVKLAKEWAREIGVSVLYVGS